MNNDIARITVRELYSLLEDQRKGLCLIVKRADIDELPFVIDYNESAPTYKKEFDNYFVSELFGWENGTIVAKVIQ